jgi:hypothetical protein
MGTSGFDGFHVQRFAYDIPHANSLTLADTGRCDAHSFPDRRRTGVYYIYTEQQKSYRGNTEDLTRAMALLLDKEMTGRIMALQTLSGSPTITDNNLPAFYQYAREVASEWDTDCPVGFFGGAVHEYPGSLRRERWSC